MGVKRLWTRVAGLVRRGGPRGFVLALLGRTVLRHVVLIERDLTIEPPRVPTDVDFRRAFLRPEDADAYAAYRPDRDRERVLARLERGSMCHVAWLDGRIVSDCWYQPGEAWVEDLDRRFELGADEAYAYDAHTEPELRGHAVTPSRATLAATDLRDRGFTRAVGFVVPENGPGLRSPRKSGWTRFGVAGHVRFGLGQVEFVRTARAGTRWRVRRRRSDRPGPPELERGGL